MDYGYGATPAMQQRLMELERQQQQYAQTYGYPQKFYPSSLLGHAVTGIEEARAAQISFDGSPSYFPSPAEGRIYEKSIGMDGRAIFKVYEISKPKEEPIYAEAGALQALQMKVEELEQTIKKGAVKNVRKSDGNGQIASDAK